MDAQQTPHGNAALEFAAALIAGQFERAHKMLSTSAIREWSASSLQEAYTKMVEYFGSPPSFVQVVQAMTEWPGKMPGDVGWAYAAIAGEGESEAVTVVVASEGGKHVIRSIEWGRP